MEVVFVYFKVKYTIASINSFFAVGFSFISIDNNVFTKFIKSLE
jgi:hypothetical protein